jgi:hypothetical protein
MLFLAHDDVVSERLSDLISQRRKFFDGERFDLQGAIRLANG